MRIVVKVGTTTLAHSTGNLNIRRVTELCRVLSDLKNAGNDVILVSSGAIGMGVGKLSLSEKPEDIPGKQAAAAVGQCELMYIYDKLFGDFNHVVAQILITGDDVQNEVRYQNFSNTIHRLLDMKALPIINENDTISVEEIQIGGNDTLGAIVAKTVGADLLVILTDTDSGTKQGTGGMTTKLNAASIATEVGIETVIINGQRPQTLYDIVEGNEYTGTHFLGKH